MQKTHHNIEFIQKTLKELYPKPNIPLYHTNAFTLLIAVLLSARCTDKVVNQSTPELFKLASTPKSMSKLNYNQIYKSIQRCGLAPTKANYILELSKIIYTQYNSKVPDSLIELQKLPGIGRKTASVVLVQWFKIPAFPVDTHIYRLSHRWKLSSSKSILKVEQDLKNIFPKKNWGDLHLRMIYYGRNFCKHNLCKTSQNQCKICKEINKFSTNST